jgi:PE family protein
MAAAAPTVAVIPAAADEVSASIAHLFSNHAQDYQALAGQAAAFQQQFVQHLNAAAGSYAATEAANAVSLPHLNASVGSAASAIAAVPGQLLNGLTSIWNDITSGLIFLWNALNILGYLAFIAAYVSLLITGLFLFFLYSLVQYGLFNMFHILIPFPIP